MVSACAATSIDLLAGRPERAVVAISMPKFGRSATVADLRTPPIGRVAPWNHKQYNIVRTLDRK